MKLFSFLLALFTIVGSHAQVADEVGHWQAQAQRVTIIRDDFGVPHIYGKTDADTVFGLLYAQCEDDFPRVEQNYIWATGRLAEVDGMDALYSDLRANLFMTQDEAIARYETAPEWLKKLCRAFADGVNYYLHTHPETSPRLLERFEPWMPMYFSEGSIGGDIERVSTSKIKAFYENCAEWPRGTENEDKKQAEMAEPQGSNGIAISGTLTRSGHPMLLINPHTSFYFRGEVHVVSEEGLNAYGAVTWGQFFVYQGFNEKTGWMHTSTYTDVIDSFREAVIKNKGRLFYRYGDELRPVDSLRVSLKYRDGEQIKVREFPIYRTHHGPITALEAGHWTATAMMWEPVKALEQSYIRTKQDGYPGFRKMMDLRTNSSNNTVYADAEGNIAYFHGNFIPVRDTLFDFTRSVDGSDPRTDWKGLHEVSECIALLNPQNGWIQNCNSTPYTAALEFSPRRGDYPKYMTLDRENFRGIHAIELLTGRSGYTVDSLVKLAHDPYLPAFGVLVPGLIAEYESHDDKNPALREPINTLAQWDYTTGEASVAMSLAHYYGMQCLEFADRPDGVSGNDLFSYWGKGLKGKTKLFEAAVKQLETDFSTWRIPWGEINRYQRPNGAIDLEFDDHLPSIPIGFASGTWGALAAYGAHRGSNTKKIYGTRGNSFAAVVEFGERVRAKSILVGGQSGDPASPHFGDQVSRYAQANWKEVAYYKEDVLKRAKSRYHPGER